MSGSPSLGMVCGRGQLLGFYLNAGEGVYALTHIFFSRGPCEQGRRFENGNLSLEFNPIIHPWVTKLGVGRADLIFYKNSTMS